MSKSCKFTKFIKKSKENAQDIICINIFDSNTRKCEKTMLINSNQESLGFNNADFENYIISHFDYIIEGREGKSISYDLHQKGYVKCWAEPFYYFDNYGAIGMLSENIEKGIFNTLIRSTKHSGAYSFLSNFDENNNPIMENENLFYLKIESLS